MKTNSQLYVGQVSHRRSYPREHAFSYRLFMLYLDLDELPHLFDPFWFWSARKFNLAWFKRSDHMGDPRKPLSEVVKQRVKAQTGHYPKGPVRLLTHLRYFGYVINPVSFYFCFDENDQQIDAVVTEVHNTPWGEEHIYVLDTRDQAQSETSFRFRHDKAFHVSPFMDMAMQYSWQIAKPTDQLDVRISSHQDNNKIFGARLQLAREPVTHANLAKVLLGYPFMTLKVVLAIYYQALRLWLKRVPIFDHPPIASAKRYEK